MRCERSVEGCADCAAEEAWELSQGHTCGETSPLGTTLCELIGETRQNPEYHRLSHLPQLCEDCETELDDHRGNDATLARKCTSGLCTEWYCPNCGETQSSEGPVNCPSCGSLRDEVSA